MEIIGQKPAAHIHRSPIGIVQFEGIELGQLCMRQCFSDEHRGNGGRRQIRPARRSADGRAGPPTGLIAPGIEGSVLVYNDERKTDAVSERIPGILVAEIQNRFQQRADEREPFSAVVQTAQIFSGDVRDRGIA